MKTTKKIWNLVLHGLALHHKFVLSGQKELALMQPPPPQELPVISIKNYIEMETKEGIIGISIL